MPFHAWSCLVARLGSKGGHKDRGRCFGGCTVLRTKLEYTCRNSKMKEHKTLIAPVDDVLGSFLASARKRQNFVPPFPRSFFCVCVTSFLFSYALLQGESAMWGNIFRR